MKKYKAKGQYVHMIIMKLTSRIYICKINFKLPTNDKLWDSYTGNHRYCLCHILSAIGWGQIVVQHGIQTEYES